MDFLGNISQDPLRPLHKDDCTSSTLLPFVKYIQMESCGPGAFGYQELALGLLKRATKLLEHARPFTDLNSVQWAKKPRSQQHQIQHELHLVSDFPGTISSFFCILTSKLLTIVQILSISTMESFFTSSQVTFKSQLSQSCQTWPHFLVQFLSHPVRLFRALNWCCPITDLQRSILRSLQDQEH